MSLDPIPLSREQIEHIKVWARDYRLWNTQEVTEFNLCTFARLMLKEALPVDDQIDVYVPGAWTCPKCLYTLQKVTLFMQTGEVGSSRNDVMNMSVEVCPNDGVMMVRETWHNRAEANRKWGTDLMEQIIALTGAEHLPGAIEVIVALRASQEPGR